MPANQPQVLLLQPAGGLSQSTIKGTPIAAFGLLLSAIFLSLQLISGGKEHGAIASVIPELQPLQQTLTGMDAKLDNIDKKLDNVKKETSDDARKELQNIGVAWTGTNFLEAVKVGDERVVTLFLKAGMHPETAESEGRSLAVMLSLNEYNPGNMLSLLLDHGLDINQRYEQYSSLGDMKTTLLGRSIEKGNVKLAKALLESGADTDQPLQTYGAMGIAINTYPLTSAIYWEQPEIALLILDAKPDVAAGDYSAYRKANQVRSETFWKQHSAEMNEILRKTTPPKNVAQRVNDELRLAEIDQELNEVGLKSIQSISNPYQKQEYDIRYDELQEEKKRLLAKLSTEK